MFQSLGEYDKAKEYLHKALVITTEIGDRNGEGACYANLKHLLCFSRSENTTRLKSISTKRLSSQLKLAKEKEKERVV